ncbi:hypothetical protein [Sphaerisporangium sp. TRM90804]|uniref:hypothetical protein n=1 Tax=Sphaerisporangium sp. TRM90804 TaxID=3031113 RepID=UPI002446AB11|nr:hypothetical protein [Sphaerisporangium sp. TRM90804]MDH2424611.1 hypothetical protein [Sphaerisporangium sp. TRM90804]
MFAHHESPVAALAAVAISLCAITATFAAPFTGTPGTGDGANSGVSVVAFSQGDDDGLEWG